MVYLNIQSCDKNLVISYNDEVIVNADKAKVVELLSDPVLVSGMLGHIALLERAEGENSYSVSLVLTYQNRVIAVPGKMEGPSFHLSNISYNGVSNDGRVKWEIAFDVRERSKGTTTVRAFASFDVKASFFSRFSSLPKAIAVMPEHLVKSHVKPYLSSFGGTSEERIELKPSFSKDGKLSEVLNRAMQVAKSAQLAVIVIEAGLMRGKIVVKGQKVGRIKAFIGVRGVEVNSLEELLSLLPNKGRVEVYTLDEGSIIDLVTDSILVPEPV